MTWDQRQRAMLAEMGYELPVRAQSVAVEAVDATEADEAPPPAAAAPFRAAPAAVAAPVAAPAPRVAVAAPTPTLAPALAPPSFADLDLPALRDAVAACSACGLCEQRRHAVFGDGAVQGAQWLVVTDPPEDADDASGTLLDSASTDSGRLLDRMLLAAGQRRVPGKDGAAPTAFVTPIVKCRPPRGRAPSPAEMAACEAILARQAALLQPRVVLAMGLQAARRLTGSAEPLGKLRGRVHSWGGLPVVVTYHPAYLLRSPADKAGAWDDLCLALKTSTT